MPTGKLWHGIRSAARVSQPNHATSSTPIVVAGGTGALGGKIARELVRQGAAVTALVRRGTHGPKVASLEQTGARVAEVDFADAAGLTLACAGASCVVSALSGLREVVVDAQSRLLDAAVRADVARFIPSDFASDFLKMPPGRNRNFDLRREFHERLDAAPIRTTSILNGAFAEMLVGPAPIVLFPLRRVLYWQDPDQPLDFTTMDDVAEYTASAALDASTPRVLRIAGDVVTARDLAATMTSLAGKPYRLVRGGDLDRLERLSHLVRALRPQPGELYPIWQGLQYLHAMYSGDAKLTPLDNDRYPHRRWTTARDVLAAKA